MGLFALPFQDKYGHLIEKLFSQITMADDTQLNARKQSELQENIQRYTDFRTYLKFDLETTDQNGSKQLLSQTLNTKSGGETQTPFYIAVLASFAQLYRVNDTSSFGNTVRLAVFDEAFNKMDSDRIIESVRLCGKWGYKLLFARRRIRFQILCQSQIVHCWLIKTNTRCIFCPLVRRWHNDRAKHHLKPIVR